MAVVYSCCNAFSPDGLWHSTFMLFVVLIFQCQDLLLLKRLVHSTNEDYFLFYFEHKIQCLIDNDTMRVNIYVHCME